MDNGVLHASIAAGTITQTIIGTMGLTKCNNEPQGENERWKNSNIQFHWRCGTGSPLYKQKNKLKSIYAFQLILLFSLYIQNLRSSRKLGPGDWTGHSQKVALTLASTFEILHFYFDECIFFRKKVTKKVN